MCYEGGCAVMTNEVPDIVVDLPTYDQVEEVKKVVVNTGGRVAGVDDKMHKAKMIETDYFADGLGVDLLNPVKIDYETRYPEIAGMIPWSVFVSRDRMHLYGDVYMIFYVNVYIVIDVRLGKVLHAQKITAGDWSTVHHSIYFEDSNYYYVKGYGNPTGTNTILVFAVIKKTTFEYVTVIKQITEPVGVIADWNTFPAGEIGCIGDRFFFSIGNEILWAYKIVFSAGVPTSFMYAGNENIGYTSKAVIVDGGFIYVIYLYGAGSAMKKYIYNTSTSSFTLSATNGMANYHPTQTSNWLYKYTYNGERMLLIGFGTGSGSKLNIYNLSALTAVSNIFNNYGTYPTINPSDDSKFYLQPATHEGIFNAGTYWDSLYEFNRTNNSWTRTTIYVPLRITWSNPNSNGTLSMSSIRTLFLGRNYSLIFDKKLYANWNTLGNINKHNIGLEYLNVTQGYKEVTQ